MWNISHPDKVEFEEYEAYDHVFVASHTYAKELASVLKVPVSPLLQMYGSGSVLPGIQQ